MNRHCDHSMGSPSVASGTDGKFYCFECMTHWEIPSSVVEDSINELLRRAQGRAKPDRLPDILHTVARQYLDRDLSDDEVQRLEDAFRRIEEDGQ